MASIAKRPDGTWRARYRDEAGKEHARHFRRKTDATDWLNEVTASMMTGNYVSPRTAKMTVGEWCDVWLEGYGTKRASTVRQARVHIKAIKAHFGTMRVGAVKPSHVKAWTAKLSEAYAVSTTYAIYRRFSQVMDDAMHDGIIARNPCSRRTSPPMAKQRPYVATTDHVWALYDAMPDHLKVAILLGAFVGLRVAEAAALRVSDVDFMRGIVTPAIQYPAQELKTEASRAALPIPSELTMALSAHVARYGGSNVVTDEKGNATTPYAIEKAMRASRVKVEGLPEGFRFHDLRHYLASLLIAQGLDVKVVQARLRHAKATTTLNVYGHLFPDAQESAQAALSRVFVARADSLRTEPALTRADAHKA